MQKNQVSFYLFKKCWEREEYLHGKYNSFNLICVLSVKKNNKQKDSLHGRPQTLKEKIESQKLKP